MSTAALFTTAKTWEQSQCPPTDGWIQKMWYIYTMEYCSAIKSKIMPFAAIWMNLEITILNKVQKRKTNTRYSINISRLIPIFQWFYIRFNDIVFGGFF